MILLEERIWIILPAGIAVEAHVASILSSDYYFCQVMTRLQQKNKCVVKLKSGLLVENAVLFGLD
jgi:hypothetical protein